MPVDPTGAQWTTVPGVLALPGVVLSPVLRGWLLALRLAYGDQLVVTSGVRTPDAQASAMQKKQDAGGSFNIYKRQDLVREITAAPRSQWAAVISRQVARGEYLSSHLSGRAVDLRTRGLSSSEISDLSDAVRKLGAKPLVESAPPHMHVEGISGAWAAASPDAIAAALAAAAAIAASMD